MSALHRRVALLCCLSIALAGCRATGSSPSATRGAADAPPSAQRRDRAAPRFSQRSAGTSIEGRPIDYSVLDAGPATLLVIASIHGNEPAGTPLVEWFVERCLAGAVDVRGVRLVVVPVANPDGLARRSRRNARGIDLNRDFPASNHAGPAEEILSEPESRAIAELVTGYDPDLVLSFHQPIGVIDYDGAAAEVAAALARACALPVRRLGARPGSLGSWVGEDRGIPIVTIELRGPDSRLSADELGARYGALLEAAVEHVRALAD